MNNDLIYHLKEFTPALQETLDPASEYIALLGKEDMTFSGAHLKEKPSKHVTHLIVPIAITTESEDIDLIMQILAKNSIEIKGKMVEAFLEFASLKNAAKKNTQTLNLQHLRTQFFLDNTELQKIGNNTGPPQFTHSPHTVFEWFKQHLKTE